MSTPILQKFLKGLMLSQQKYVNGNLRIPHNYIEEGDCDGAAIFVPLYITPQNKGEWAKVVSGMLKNVGIPVFYGVSYPTQEYKWDIALKETTSTPYQLVEDSIRDIPKDLILYDTPNREHVVGLIQAMEMLARKGFTHMIHVEQDVWVNPSILRKMKATCIKYDRKYLFMDMSTSNGVPLPDISLWCIDLTKTLELEKGLPKEILYREGRYLPDGRVIRETRGEGYPVPEELKLLDVFKMPYSLFKEKFWDMLQYAMIDGKTPLEVINSYVGGSAENPSSYFDVFRLVYFQLYMAGELLLLTNLRGHAWHYQESRRNSTETYQIK